MSNCRDTMQFDNSQQQLPQQDNTSNRLTHHTDTKKKTADGLAVIDIIFANRNKKYGAYYLRKQYNRHLRIGVLLTFSLFLFVIISPYITDFLGYSNWFKPKKQEDLFIIPVNLENPLKSLPPPPQEKPAPPKEKPKPKPPPKNKPPVPKKDLMPQPAPQLPIQPTPQQPLSNVDTHAGEASKPDNKDNVKNEGTADGTEKEKSAKIDTTTTYLKLDAMPMFPGGMTALQKYIYNNMRYPPSAKKDTIQGMVTASFIVQEDGSITDVNIMDAPPNCNECRGQVIKNLYKMPEWVPGRRNGRPVKVRCLIQVNFELGE